MHAINRRIAPTAIILSLLICAIATAQSPAPSPARATRSISAAYALPESTVRITLVLTADRDLAGVSIDEHVPVGWTIHPLDSNGAAFKRSTGTWVFAEPIPAGGTRRIVYELTVPEAGRLFRDPLPQCFHVDGTLQSTVPAFETPIGGEGSIEVTSYLPIESAISHLVPETEWDPDRIDLRLSKLIEADQLHRALELWRAGAAVAGTGGARIDLPMIDRLVAYHETCTPVDHPLPLTLDPQLGAVRTIHTFLPGDSVLLPEGCLDPGLSARRFSVTVDITSGHDAYGIGYRESFPARWRVTPIRHDGWWYREAAAEWAYPGRLAAGETLRIVYTVEVLPSAGDDLAESDGCCGRDVPFIGAVTSALGCEESPVDGDGSVYSWRCLPVVLAISRWNGGEDRFDATLSDRITFDQVQRAVEFWLTEEPVPHTCGYTVGYETLKEIVAYWLSGDPVTGPLPGAPTGGCDRPSDLECAGRDGGIAWFCEMASRQDDADRVGPPPPAPLTVDAGPD